MNKSDYVFWMVLAVLLAVLWGILGLMVYLSFVVPWTVAWTAPLVLAMCLYATWMVGKTIREQRKVNDE